jgi:GrpB-like predicted nucleotidyltransferase (UPF0157 family)
MPMSKELSDMTLEELWELFPIILKDHNSKYSQWYSEEKQNLLSCLNPNDIKRMNHIGSSAVKGLIAKPTVDILLEISNDCDIMKIKRTLADNGWTLMSEETKPNLKLAFNKGYTLDGFAEKVYHLHVRYSGDWNEFYFRDYLQAHDEVAAEYGKLKLLLAEQYKHNRDGYTNAKSDFVLKYTNLARKEFPGRYKPIK